LLNHKDKQEAEGWLKKLEQREPGTLRTVALKARLLAQQGNRPKAVAALQQFARQNGQLQGAVAALLEQMGAVGEAEQAYERLRAQAKRPQDALELAKFLGRQKRPAEALAVCRAAEQTCPPEAVGEAYMLVLYSAKATEEQQDQVAQWLEKASASHPEKTALLHHLALVRRLQGRYRDAINLYRRVLAKHDHDATAWNNLAWLLAFEDAPQALKAVQRALDIAGPTPGALDTRGVVYLNLRQSEAAVQDLAEVVAQRPSAGAYFHLAQAYDQAGDRTQAARAWQQAKDLGLTLASTDPLERESYAHLDGSYR
jgi:tetratricopeptide (TPR) repeat protein